MVRKNGNKNVGWHNEPGRHSLAAKGVKTSYGRGHYREDPRMNVDGPVDATHILDGGIIKSIEIDEDSAVAQEDEVEVKLELVDLSPQGNTYEGDMSLILPKKKAEQLEGGKVIEIDYYMDTVDASRDPHKTDIQAYPVFEELNITGCGEDKIEEWKEENLTHLQDSKELMSEDDFEDYKEFLEDRAEELKEEIK